MRRNLENKSMREQRGLNDTLMSRISLTLIRCTHNFDIQQELYMSLKSRPLLPIFNNKIMVMVSAIFRLGKMQLFVFS